MSEQLPDALTHVDPEELAHALTAAWQDIFGDLPPRASILVLLAQSALETGRWKSCHAWNLGNVKHTPNDGRDFTYYRCNEVLNEKIVWFDPPNPACCFRAFRTLAEGAADHLVTMYRNFRSAWPAVLAGDPRRFVQLLKAAHYFTAAEGPYENAVASLFSFYSSSLHYQPRPDGPAIDDETRARVLGLVALSLNELAAEAVTGPDDVN